MERHGRMDSAFRISWERYAIQLFKSINQLISNQFLQTNVDGLTGAVKLDPDGRRSDFNVQIYSLISHGMVPTGTWNPNDGISMSKTPHPTLIGINTDSLFNKTFIVLTVIVCGDNLFVIDLIVTAYPWFYCCTESTVWNAEGLIIGTDWKQSIRRFRHRHHSRAIVDAWLQLRISSAAGQKIRIHE